MEYSIKNKKLWIYCKFYLDSVKYCKESEGFL